MFASGRKSVGGLSLADLDWQNSVLEIADNTAVPATEVTGDRYLLDATGGGVHANWDGAAVNDIVEFNGTTWDITYVAAGSEGGATWVEDLDTNYIWDGSTWAAFGSTVTHNNTAGLQGGAASEYYHTTDAEHTEATRDATNAQNGLMPAGKLTGWDAAATHVSNDGSDHSKVGANETAIGLNTTHRGLTSGNPHGVTPSETVMARIAGSTYSTVQDMQNVFHSAGWVSGGVVADDADGTITVATGTGLIRAADTAVAEILFCDWAQESGVNVDLADNDVSYVYVEYNGGAPRAVATTTERTDFNTNILLAVVSREGTVLHINQTEQHTVGDHANAMIRRLKGVQPYGHVSGAILSETGTRNIKVTAGLFWRGLTEFITSGVDTSGAPTFSYYYNNGSWQKVSGVSDIHQTNYNDFGTGLATLSNNKYGVHWIYLEADDEDVSVVYGIGDYTLAEAENAQPPSALPLHLQTEGILAGKIIIKKTGTVFTQVESAFQTKFTGSIATDHNNTAGLQGGAANEYYHLTSDQHGTSARLTNAGLVHGGKRERFPGNSGLGQSFPSYVNYTQAANITGTRTSDTVFTRTSGTWIASGLVDQWAFSYVQGSEGDGVWRKIVSNTTTAITISGVLYAGTNRIITSVWRPNQNEYPHGKGSGAFRGGAFDGESIWLAPYNSDDVVKINSSDGSMTSYTHGKGAAAFFGAVFDGESIWLVPYNSDDVVKINPVDGSMTSYTHGKGDAAFSGGAFDGKNLWFAPTSSSDLIKIDPSTGTITSYAHGKGSYAFYGCNFDGEYVWLIPNNSDDIVRVDISDGSMVGYAHGEGDGAFVGSIFDGKYIWIPPQGASDDDIIRLDPSDGSLLNYPHTGGSIYGGCYDGESVWMTPASSTDLVKLNPSDGSLTLYAHGKGSSAFFGAIFDGERIWLIPSNADDIVSFIPPRFGRAATISRLINLVPAYYTATPSFITGAPSLSFDADGELIYINRQVPKDWDGISDLVLKVMIQNEIAETDGDDVSFTWTVHGIGDGETGVDVGQTCTMILNLTGGDQAINKVNLCSATIDHDHGTYPISPGDMLVLKGEVNLAGGGECTGPLHMLTSGLEYTAKK